MAKRKLDITEEDIEETNDIAKVAKKVDPKIIQLKKYLLDFYEFRLNKTTSMLEFRLRGNKKFIPFLQKHKSDLIVDLKCNGFAKPKEDLEDLLNSSFVSEYNLFQDYFENVEFKGTGFIKQMASKLILSPMDLNINDKSYQEQFNIYWKKWLMACYNCFTGAQKNDVMLILIGAQGRFKTSFLNFLTPKEMQDYSFTGHITPSLSDYNTATYLTEKLFINVDDQMETIFGKDYNSMKAIISIDDLSIRKLYKADHSRKKRVANFCGSVNEPRFLRDSNNRRYLCFMIDDIMSNYLDVDINAMWAEVREELKAIDTPYLFSKDDFAVIDKLNSQFHSPSMEDEIFTSIFAPAEDEPSKDVYYMMFSEIFQVLKRHTGDNSLKEFKLQTAMRKHEFKQKNKRVKRLGNQPRSLYIVKLVNSNIALTNLCEPYCSLTKQEEI